MKTHGKIEWKLDEKNWMKIVKCKNSKILDFDSSNKVLGIFI